MSKRISLRRRAGILRRLEDSGLSVAEYCRRHGLCYSTVMRWRREAHVLPDHCEAMPSFVEVEVCPGDEGRTAVQSESLERSEPALCAELALPGGALLRIYGNVSPGNRS